ncbi:Uncharacterised protein [Vibrio cholerae]|nr:Uncharacterised protein [Vibrio cholerae]CSI27754.1 Uncharacterised protein [Vibrio cholerae]
MSDTRRAARYGALLGVKSRIIHDSLGRTVIFFVFRFEAGDFLTILRIPYFD